MKRVVPGIALVALLLVGCSSGKKNSANNSSLAPQTVAAEVTTPAPSASTVPSTTPSPAPRSSAASPTPGRALATPTPAAVRATTPPGREAALARSLLLTVDDFATGWTETPKDRSTPNPLDSCDSSNLPGETGRADSGDFSNGDDANLTETVVLFGTAPQATAALDAAQTTIDCAVKLINSGGADDSDTTVSGATTSALSFPRLGDAGRAYRVKFHIKVKVSSGNTNEADAYVDLIYQSVGRAAINFTAININGAYDSTLLQQATRIGLSKAQKGSVAR